MDPLFSSMLNEPYHLLSVAQATGRTIAASAYMGEIPVFPSEVAWVVSSNFLAPMRIERDYLSTGWTTELPYAGAGLDARPHEVDYRRTVSADMAWGFTAVGLMSNFGGSDVIFEWSNYGEWENLPLPEGIEHMTMPELVVGTDGRWHILYHNYELDRMMCISTL